MNIKKIRFFVLKTLILKKSKLKAIDIDNTKKIFSMKFHCIFKVAPLPNG